MIGHLSGILFKKSTQSIIIDNRGIGYEVFVPLSTFYTLPEDKGDVSLHIHTHVREDSLTLYGFGSDLEKNIFLMLISVSGIGPKLALNILSGIGPEDLIHAIAFGDAIRLQAIPGVGKKMAERIALELKEKASQMGTGTQLPPSQVIPDVQKKLFDDALSALMNLGYSAKPAKRALEKAVTTDEIGDLEDLIKQALTLLSK
jgi:Holliday junction DNA helicase RuvA